MAYCYAFYFSYLSVHNQEKMSIDDLKKLAYLARLDIDEREIDKFSGDLEKILEFTAQHVAMNIDAVEPLSHPLDLSQRLRSDQPEDFKHREKFQKLSSKHKDGYYLVPKIID